MLIINATPADSLNLSQVIIFFSLSSFEAAPRSPCIPKPDAADVSRLKATGIKDLRTHAYYKCHPG